MSKPTADCPAWCKSDHDHYIAHLGPAFGDKVICRAILDPAWPAPRILIDNLTDAEMYLFLGADDAARLARLLDASGGTLAHLIRLATAVLNEDGIGL